MVHGREEVLVAVLVKQIVRLKRKLVIGEVLREWLVTLHQIVRLMVASAKNSAMVLQAIAGVPTQMEQKLRALELDFLSLIVIRS